MMDLVQTLREERERLTEQLVSDLSDAHGSLAAAEINYLVRGVVNTFIVSLAERSTGHFEEFLRDCAERMGRAGQRNHFETVWQTVERLGERLWTLALEGETAGETMARWEGLNRYLRQGRSTLVQTYLQEQDSEQKRLTLALERYAHLTENVPSIVYSTDQQGHLTAINHAATQLLGYAKEELLGAHYSLLMDEEDARQMGRLINERRTGDRSTKRLRLRMKDRQGGLHEFELSATGVYNDAGDFLGTDGIARPMALETLQLTYVLDEEGRFVSVSDEVLVLLGYSPEELQGQHFSLLMEEPEFELMGRLFGERRASERAADRVTLHLVDWEGRRREFEVSATGRYDEANRFLGTQGVARDVTEQSHLEQEIAHERSKFRTVFDAVGIGLSINGLDLRVREANQCQRELYQGRQIEGQHCYRVYFGQNKTCAWCGLAQAAETGQTVVRENVFNPKNGRLYHLTFSPLREENQRLSRVIEVMTDVTDWHNVGQQMARTEKLQALGRLAGGVTNRLNNALSMILGRAQMLQPRAVEEDLRRGLETIIRATEEAARTVHQIQRFALTPRSDEAFQAVDLNEVVCDALHATEARWRDQAQLESVAIDVRTILAEPDLLVQGQHNELVEAFTNLIINAVEAMPLGGTLTLETRREDDRASVSVSDTGEGMEEEVQQHIFDPFFTTKGVGASGMGLSVSRSIFERHGADIWVDSEVGRGTTFHIEFAAVEGERPVEETPALGRAVGARRILIAEDEEHLRELLRDILITEGHEVVMCADGVSALEEFARQPCDFVFTDLSMPGRSGWDVVREVKAQRPGVPVVIITGWGASIDQTVIAEAGADAIIAKPYNVTEILQLVNTLGAERDT